jgi:hypothetical protein
VNLYLRLLWIWLHARLKPPIRLGDTIEMRLRVWPSNKAILGLRVHSIQKVAN